MDDLIPLYQQRLNLQDAFFSRVDHEDAMVSLVYKVTQPSGNQLILKICPRVNDYLRELYFLSRFAASLPVPRIIQVLEPEPDVSGAILMERFPGTLIRASAFSDSLAYDLGSKLAHIHSCRVEGYGDLALSQKLSPDPRFHFSEKFEEGLEECKNHLPKEIIEKASAYYESNLKLFDSVDGPCIIHRDFRPGNLIVCDGKLQGILDWSSGRAGFAEDDFCPMEHGEWPLQPSHRKSFLAGYASIRSVPDYAHIMPLLRLNRALAVVGFTVKRGTWKSCNARPYKFNRQFLEEFLQSY